MSATVSDNSNGATLSKDRLYIKQWRPNEYVEITVISEGPNPPSLKISDSEILESEISYSVYSPKQDSGKSSLIEWLPNWFVFVLKWFLVIFIAIGVISLLIQIPKESRKIPEIGIKIITIMIGLLFTMLFASPLLWIL